MIERRHIEAKTIDNTRKPAAFAQHGHVKCFWLIFMTFYETDQCHNYARNPYDQDSATKSQADRQCQQSDNDKGWRDDIKRDKKRSDDRYEDHRDKADAHRHDSNSSSDTA